MSRQHYRCEQATMNSCCLTQRFEKGSRPFALLSASGTKSSLSQGPNAQIHTNTNKVTGSSLDSMRFTVSQLHCKISFHEFFECSRNNMFGSSLWSFWKRISLAPTKTNFQTQGLLMSVGYHRVISGNTLARQAASCKKRYNCHTDSVVILGRLGDVDLCKAWNTEIAQEMSRSKDQ